MQDDVTEMGDHLVSLAAQREEACSAAHSAFIELESKESPEVATVQALSAMVRACGIIMGEDSVCSFVSERGISSAMLHDYDDFTLVYNELVDWRRASGLVSMSPRNAEGSDVSSKRSGKGQSRQPNSGNGGREGMHVVRAILVQSSAYAPKQPKRACFIAQPPHLSSQVQLSSSMSAATFPMAAQEVLAQTGDQLDEDVSE